MADGDSMGPGLQLSGAQFSNILRNLSCEFKLRGLSIFHKIQMAICRYCVRLQTHGQAVWLSYMYCACRCDLDLIQCQGHGAFKLPKIALV